MMDKLLYIKLIYLLNTEYTQRHAKQTDSCSLILLFLLLKHTDHD